MCLKHIWTIHVGVVKYMGFKGGEVKGQKNILLNKCLLDLIMLSKEKILQTVNELPEQFSIEDLFERIILLQKIELGLEQSKSGRVLSTGQARERLKKWLLK